MNDYRILVVDDEEDLCEILKFNLENEGYFVDTANSAEEALKMELTQYNLLLLDVMMGEISGFKMANMLKKNKATASIPIIFITAKDTAHAPVTGFNLGADDYISKPFEIDELRARIRALLRRPRNMDKVEEISFGNVKLYPQKMILESDSKTVTLSKKENLLLEFFMRKQGQTIMREQILARLWG